MKRFAKICAMGVLGMTSLSVMAGMPSSYAPVSLDVALARAKQDGRPIMIYFGEDW